MGEVSRVKNVASLLEEATRSRHAIEAARNLYGDRLAPEFSPLQFLWLDELTWSKLIGWLLDPKGSHAQKGRFLHLFTRHVSHVGQEWPEETCDKALLKLEESSDHGRIDILIEADDRLLIIENKPYAADQDQQLLRYYAYAEVRHLDRLKTTIVYLTSRGTPPSEASLSGHDVKVRQEDGTLVLQSYQALALASASGTQCWLDECRLACRSSRVSDFIADIQKQINAEFSGVRDMNESDALIELMSRGADNLRSSFQISSHMSILKEKMKSNFRNQIDEVAKDAGFELVWDEFPWKPYGGFTLSRADGSPFVVRIASDGGEWTQLGVGLHWQDGKPTGRDSARIAEATSAKRRLDEKLKPGFQWNEWPWWSDVSKVSPLPHNWQADVDVWIKINAGRTVAEEIMFLATKIFESLSEVGSGSMK